VRLDTVSSNLANLNSLERDENGHMQPYQARYVIFQADEQLATKDGGVGVKIARVETEKVEPLYRWQPSHPYAIKDGPKKGYVAYPNVNMTAEMVDALVSTGSYVANIGAMELSKNMAQQSLRILG